MAVRGVIDELQAQLDHAMRMGTEIQAESAQKLCQLLERSRNVFSDLLEFKKKNAADRNRILSGAVRLDESNESFGGEISLDDAQIKLVVGLSDWLSLNEIECLRLFIEVSDQRNFPSSDMDTAMRVVAGHYFDTRKAILQALSSTLYLVVSESIFELQEWISDYIESLIQPSENPSMSLLERLTALIARNPLIAQEDGFDASQTPYIDMYGRELHWESWVLEEQLKLPDILVYVIAKMVDSKNREAILQTIKMEELESLLYKLDEWLKQSRGDAVDDLLHYQIHGLFLRLSRASSTTEIQPAAGEVGQGMRYALDLLRSASGIVMGGDTHMVTLEGLQWLSLSLLKESRFPENIGVYVSDMIKELIFSLLKVGDLLNLETLWPSSTRKSKKSLLGANIIQSRQKYAALIKVLSRVNTNLARTANTPSQWWENDPEFSNVLNSMEVIARELRDPDSNALLDTRMVEHCEDLVGPYLVLLDSLAKDPRFSKTAFDHVDDKGTVVDWIYLVDLMWNWMSFYEEKEASLERGDSGSSDNKQLSAELSVHVQQMPPAFDHTLLAGLRLLASSLSGSTELPESSRREIIGRLQEIVGYFCRINIIEFLLNFHACPVSTSLKGATLEVISSIAESPELVSSVWYSLQQANVLEGLQPIGSNQNGNDAIRGGIFSPIFSTAQDSVREASAKNSSLTTDLKYQMQEIEAREEHYPNTVAFLKLFLKILNTVPRANNVDAMTKCVMFVKDCVFQDYRKRKYRDDEERQLVADLCIQIFQSCLSDDQNWRELNTVATAPSKASICEHIIDNMSSPRSHILENICHIIRQEFPYPNSLIVRSLAFLRSAIAVAKLVSRSRHENLAAKIVRALTEDFQALKSIFVMVAPGGSSSNSDTSLASLELIAELATYGTVGSAFLASGVSPYDRQDVQFAFAEALADSVATPTYIHPAKAGALATSQYTDNKRCRLIVDEILMRALPKFSSHSGHYVMEDEDSYLALSLLLLGFRDSQPELSHLNPFEQRNCLTVILETMLENSQGHSSLEDDDPVFESISRLLATLVDNPITQTPMLHLIREEPCNLFLDRLERLTRCPPSAEIFEYAHERILSAMEQRTMLLRILSTELFYCESSGVQRTKELYRRRRDSRRLISSLLFNVSQNKGLSELLIEDLCSGWAKDRDFNKAMGISDSQKLEYILVNELKVFEWASSIVESTRGDKIILLNDNFYREVFQCGKGPYFETIGETLEQKTETIVKYCYRRNVESQYKACRARLARALRNAVVLCLNNLDLSPASTSSSDRQSGSLLREVQIYHFIRIGEFFLSLARNGSNRDVILLEVCPSILLSLMDSMTQIQVNFTHEQEMTVKSEVSRIVVDMLLMRASGGREEIRQDLVSPMQNIYSIVLVFCHYCHNTINAKGSVVSSAGPSLVQLVEEKASTLASIFNLDTRSHQLNLRPLAIRCMIALMDLDESGTLHNRCVRYGIHRKLNQDLSASGKRLGTAKRLPWYKDPETEYVYALLNTLAKFACHPIGAQDLVRDGVMNAIKSLRPLFLAEEFLKTSNLSSKLFVGMMKLICVLQSSLPRSDTFKQELYTFALEHEHVLRSRLDLLWVEDVSVLRCKEVEFSARLLSMLAVDCVPLQLPTNLQSTHEKVMKETLPILFSLIDRHFTPSGFGRFTCPIREVLEQEERGSGPNSTDSAIAVQDRKELELSLLQLQATLASLLCSTVVNSRIKFDEFSSLLESDNSEPRGTLSQTLVNMIRVCADSLKSICSKMEGFERQIEALHVDGAGSGQEGDRAIATEYAKRDRTIIGAVSDLRHFSAMHVVAIYTMENLLVAQLARLRRLLESKSGKNLSIELDLDQLERNLAHSFRGLPSLKEDFRFVDELKVQLGEIFYELRS